MLDTIFTTPIQAAQPAPVIHLALNQTNQKIHEAFCDFCSEQATGTVEFLRGEGWGIYGAEGVEYCPFHESEI